MRAPPPPELSMPEEPEDNNLVYAKITKILNQYGVLTREPGESCIQFVKRLFVNKISNSSNWTTKSMFTRAAQEYAELIRDIAHSMAPDSVGDKFFMFVNNMLMMDRLVERIPRLIGLSEDEKLVQDVKATFKASDVKCPIDWDNVMMDTRITSDLGFFLGYIGKKAVGESFTLKLLKHVQENGKHVMKTVETKFTIKFSSGRIVDQMTNGYSSSNIICKKPDSPYVMVLEQEGTNILVVLITDMAKMIDNTLSLVDSGAGWYSKRILLIYDKKSKKEAHAYRYCDMPYSMIDLDTMSLRTVWGDISIATEYLTNVKRRAHELVDPAARQIFNHIYNGIDAGISRSYALVGIPGTGKSALMDYITSHLPADTLVITIDSERGLETFSSEGGRYIFDIKFRHLVVLVDDADRLYDEKKSFNLINMFSTLHTGCPGVFGQDESESIQKNFALIATINDPTVFPDAVIKRSGRFDEVINIKLPSTKLYSTVFSGMKRDNDLTDYDSLKFKLCFKFAKLRKITLADIRNVYEIMLVHSAKCTDCKYKFSVSNFIHAVNVIVKNKKNADKKYTI